MYKVKNSNLNLFMKIIILKMYLGFTIGYLEIIFD